MSPLSEKYFALLQAAKLELEAAEAVNFHCQGVDEDGRPLDIVGMSNRLLSVAKQLRQTIESEGRYPTPIEAFYSLRCSIDFAKRRGISDEELRDVAAALVALGTKLGASEGGAS